MSESVSGRSQFYSQSVCLFGILHSDLFPYCFPCFHALLILKFSNRKRLSFWYSFCVRNCLGLCPWIHALSLKDIFFIGLNIFHALCRKYRPFHATSLEQGKEFDVTTAKSCFCCSNPSKQQLVWLLASLNWLTAWAFGGLQKLLLLLPLPPQLRLVWLS